MDWEVTPSINKGSRVKVISLGVCVHCKSSDFQKVPKIWPVTHCIRGQMTVADVLHKKAPDSCQFRVSNDNFICNRCYTVLEKIVQKEEAAVLLRKECLKSELELKMLHLQGQKREKLRTALLDKDTTETDCDEDEVEWFAMMTDSKTHQLVKHCSVRGGAFVEKNREILNSFTEFCFSYNKEPATQIDHNYSSKESAGDKELTNQKTDEKGAAAPCVSLVPSILNGRSKEVKSASAQKSSDENVLQLKPVAVQVDSEPKSPDENVARPKPMAVQVASAPKSTDENGAKPKPLAVQKSSDEDDVEYKPVAVQRVGRRKRKVKKKIAEPSSESETDQIVEPSKPKSARQRTQSALRVSLRTRKGIGPDKDQSYSSFAGITPSKSGVQYNSKKVFIPSHIDVFSLDHPGNKEVAEKILTTFKKIDPDEPPRMTPRIKSKPWSCLKCYHITTSRKRALLHFRLMHDVRDLWSRFHICQIMPEKGKENEELQDQYRLHRPYLCVLCGRDYVNKSAEFHISRDHPGITAKQIPLIIVKKLGGPKLIIIYLYGRSPITYLLDSKGRMHEIRKIDTSLLKQKVSFAFQEMKPTVSIGIDGEHKEEGKESGQRYQVEVSMHGCSLADTQPGNLGIFATEEPNKPADDLSMLRTKLLEKVGIGSGLPTKKTKVNISNEIDQPRYVCKVCHAASNSKNIQELHHINHPKQVGKWECTLCVERFTKANLIINHIGTFHNLLAHQALSHMKAIGVEVSAKLLYNLEVARPSNNEETNSTESDERVNTSEIGGRIMNENEDEIGAVPSIEDLNDWKKQLQELKSCELCCKPMKTDAALMKHMRLVHKIRNYRCPTCGMSFITYSHLLFHMEESHKPPNHGNYLCTTCNRVFTCRNDFLHHCINHMKDNFRCNICNDILFSADRLNRHVQSHYPTKAILDTPYICPICNKLIKERKKVEMHLVTHCTTMIEAYRCTFCPKTCVTEQGLRSHIEGHKKNKELICHICGKVFKRPHRLRDHLRMHENPDPFKCRICHKMVSSEEGLKRHMDTVHSTSRKKEVVCHICGKELASNFSLTMHLKLVHNPNKVKRPLKNRQCQYCNKVYAKPYQLTNHIEVHHAGRNFYPCKYCGQTFSSRSLYRKHVDIHPEFKPWCCEFCPEKFVFQKTLIDHVTKSHPGGENAKIEKRFVCKICGNTYGKLWSLRNHVDVEHNDARQLGKFEKLRYFCTFCNRGFLYKTGMETHMAKAHKDEVNVTEAEMIAVEAVAQEETVTVVQAVADDPCVIEAPATITLEQEAAVQLLSQLQFQVEQSYVIQ